MNKREKAIWNIAIVISTIVIISFIYSLWDTQSALSLKKKNFISTLKKFKEYGIPSSAALSSILNDNNISIQKNSTATNKEKTISNEKDFIEYKEVVSNKKDLKAIEAKAPFTSIVGFAVKGNSKWDENETFEDGNNNGRWDADEDFTDRENKIKPGCYLLTEINGKRFKKAACSTYDLVINDITFFNDRNPLLGFENLNNYGTITNGEEFQDAGNGQWDEGETFEDTGNGQYDEGEAFQDIGNGQYDEGEAFQDIGNGQYDEGEAFQDTNGNETWDMGDPYEDLNNNNSYDAPEGYEDTNNNGRWDEGERFKDLNTSGTWDMGDLYEDLDNNGTYSYDENFTDKPDGIWNGEEFQDAGNGQWDEGETFEDTGNGQYDEGEAFQDIGNGQYDEGETFEDINDNGQWDYVLLKNLKATKEEVEEALKSNYFYSKITDKDKKINIYIKTDKEIDEYNLKANCFECTISKLEESMNSLEISLKGQREHEFVLPETLTDPTDLSNVVILPGYEGGYNQSARRNAPRLSLIVGDGNSLNSYVSIEYKGHNYVLKEGDRLEDDGVIHKINKDNVEYKKDNEIKILTLDKK